MTDKQTLDSHRRGFLMMAGMSFAAMSFNPSVIEDGVESLTSPVEKIVTDDATFYPNFEWHDDHSDLSQKIQGADNHPLIYFRECLVEPGFTRNTNYDILTSSYTTWNGSKTKLGSLLTSNEISSLYEKKAFVSLENLVYDPQKVNEDFERSNKDFNLYATAAAVTTGFNLFNKLKGNEVTGKAVIENVVSLLGLGWSSGIKLEKISAELDKLPSNQRVDEIKNALNNISAFISHLHPENKSIFFRNIYGARKMQIMARQMKEYDKDSDPGIVFCYGKLHRGINDLLTLGPDITLSGFSLYSNATLRAIIKENGGINEFCKIIKIPIKDVNLKANNVKQFIYDTELRDYLKNRLGEEKI